jgi:2-polyprenyl-6-methoxyphenol hydroxylase-like FAD-dependent oxidoreductase
MLYFVYNPHVVGVVVAHDIDAGEYVCQIPYFPPHQRLADFTVGVCRGLVANASGAETSECNVLSVRPWRMVAATAQHFASAKRVILAGDACHQFPPAGAFGMNTGLQDARNLAWKLAWSVLHQHTAPIETYDAERRPAAAAVAAKSVANYHTVLRTGATVGADASHLDAVSLTRARMDIFLFVHPAG